MIKTNMMSHIDANIGMIDRNDLNALNIKIKSLEEQIKELYHFIEMTEALTYDQATATRIGNFLKEKGIWT